MDWFLEQARLGNLFRASNQTAATITLINTSTATGFILSNSFGSGKKLIIRDIGFQYTTVPAAAAVIFVAQSIAVHATPVTHTTPLAVYRADGSGATTECAGRVDAAATTPNLPVYARSIGYSPTTPATTGGLNYRDYCLGAIILVPGTFLQISYITTAPVGIADATWAEVAA